MIQMRTKINGMGYRIVLIAINTIIETCINARTTIFTVDNSCGPDDATAAHDYNYYCCCQQ